MRSKHDLTADPHDRVARHRENLLAQARLLERVPLWYVAPLAVGYAAIVIGVGLQVGQVGVFRAVGAIVGGVVFAWISVSNVRGARELRDAAALLR